MMQKLTQEDLGAWLDKRAREMRTFAHTPAHFIHVYRQESAEGRFPRDLVYRMKLPSWETRIVFVYSVDVLADGRHLRHLSIQVSVPGRVSQGEINTARAMLIELFDPMVRLFFPFEKALRHQLSAYAPIPVVDPRAGGDGVAHFRTPVVGHFVCDWTGETVPVVLPEPGTEPARPARPFLPSPEDVAEACARLVDDHATVQVARGYGEEEPGLRALAARLRAGGWWERVPTRARPGSEDA